MDGIDWTALPIICDLLGIEDPALLIHQLILIREHNSDGQPET